MTLRLEERHDQMLTRLAERWGVSKTEAVVRALEAADSGTDLDADVTDAYARTVARYRDALDRLGSV
ncbi:hypothetical protein [Demequina sp.]|uniref:hypothetical protein n=1 Tax=Demequina sp. TaxID=2050685 RepID=UPI003D098D0E